jgi:hypothetical protein
MQLSNKERSIAYRALYGYAQWCRDRAAECAQKTSEAPIEAVGQAFAEADAADALRARLETDRIASSQASGEVKP